MRRIVIFVFVLVCGSGQLLAQDEGFLLKVSADTILAGNVLQISFEANNVAGKFEAPDMEGLQVVSGPNTSTSMSMVNGTVTQRAIYSYGVYAEENGEIMIPPAYLVTNEGTLETEPRQVVVLPNPEGIIEQPPSQSGYFQFSFPGMEPKLKKKKQEESTSKKKKRKLKKI